LTIVGKYKGRETISKVFISGLDTDKSSFYYNGKGSGSPPTTNVGKDAGEKGTLILCWWECKLVQPL
jgi:hypothetical protein